MQPLPGGLLPVLIEDLVELLEPLERPVVALALDRLSQLALWETVQQLDDVLVVHTIEAAERLLDMLEGGADVDDILCPPGFSVQACLEPEAESRWDGPLRPRLRIVESVRPTGPGGAAVSSEPDDRSEWLVVHENCVEVRTEGLSSLERRALESRGRRSSRVRRRTREGQLLIGPANYAGQAWEWAKAVRTYRQGWDAANIAVFPESGALSFGADLPLVHEDWQSPVTRVDAALDQVLGSTHVLIEAMRPILGTGAAAEPDGWDPYLGRQDADALAGSGRRIGLLFHGSEVRRPEVHAYLTPWSPFHMGDHDAITVAMTRTTTRVHDAIDGFAGPRFVSTLDLLDYVPDAIWLPTVVGPASFRQAPPALQRNRPIVAHAPSSSALKGSAWVDPVLERLNDKGLITYLRVTNVPPVGVTSLLRTADVLVDQIVLGNPGVLAAQAMAAGRLVIAHLPESVRMRYPEPVPIVEANPETLEDVVLSILEDRERFAAIARSGTDFARTYHDGRLSAQVLADGFLQ